MVKKVILIICIIFIIIGGFIFISNKNMDVKAEKEELNDEVGVSKDKTNTKKEEDEPKKNEPYKETTIIENEVTDKKEEIKLKYDQYVIANGFMGASDNAYYTRNNVLYHLIISSNETFKLAEGVDKIEDDKDTLLVYKGKNFKLIKDDDYITYID